MRINLSTTAMHKFSTTSRGIYMQQTDRDALSASLPLVACATALSPVIDEALRTSRGSRLMVGEPVLLAMQVLNSSVYEH